MELTSLGKQLVTQAVLANKVEHLRTALTARSKIPDSEFTAHVLLAMLAAEVRDLPLGKETLTKLCQMAKDRPDHNTTALLSHAVIPALNQDDLALSAEPVTDRVTTYLNMDGDAAKNKHLSQILARLARQHFKAGRRDEGRRLLERYQKLQERKYGKLADDLIGSIHKRALYRTAEEFARAGQLPDALVQLGRAADLPRDDDFTDSTDVRQYHGVYRLLMALPPGERYQSLNSWTLANASRNAVRILDHLGPDNGSPVLLIEDFLKVLQVQQTQRLEILKPLKPLNLVNQARSAKLLVQAAIDVDELGELEAQVTALAKDNVKGARELWLLIQLARPQPVAP